MKLNRMITPNPISFFILLAIIGLVLPTLLIPFWVLKIKAIENEVDLITKKSHEETWSAIQHASTTFLPMKSEATKLAKLANESLSKTDSPFSDIESKVSPLLFQALLTIPHLTQISYIRQDGELFALYSNHHQQMFSIYSNTSFSNPTKSRNSYYSQPVDLDTGKLYGDAVVFPSQVWINETLLQHTRNASASLGKSFNNDNNTLVLNTAGVDKYGVISLGFDLKSLMDVFSGIINPSGGSFYLSTKDGKVLSELDGSQTIFSQIWNGNHGNMTLESQVLEISGTKYILYSSSLDIIGMESVYVLAFAYGGGLESKIHKNIVFALMLSLMFVSIAIPVFIFMVSTLRAARTEMCLRAKLIKQKEATQEAERKRMNQSLAFVTASHDIRASLAGISGLLEMSISEVDQQSELAKNLRLLHTCSGDLSGILNSILDTSKIEAGKMELEEKQFDLVTIVEEVVDLFYPVGLKKGVDVILDLQDGLLTKFSQVKGDERRLKQILSNLLSNAVKFTSEGNVSVTAWARKHRLQNSRFDSSTHRRCLRFRKEARGELEVIDDDADYSMEFVFEVNDTGKGIPKEKQASIFENYVQVKETKAPQLEQGTGLGLGIVRSLVKLMGGEISIVNKQVGGKGTCFRFNIVLKVCVSDPISSGVSEDDMAVKRSLGSSNGLFYSPNRRGYKYNSSIVLLFISSGERRKMVQKFLAARGVKVLPVENIRKLSQTLRECRQNLICSSRSDLSSSFGYLTWPGPKGVGTPLSAMDGNGSDTPNQERLILVVIDTTRVDFLELCKAVGEFRRESRNACSRIVWLGSKWMHLQGLDQKKLPPSDIIIPMPLHGSRLHSLMSLLPEFGGTPPHPNQHQITKQEEEIQEEIVRVSPLRGKKMLVAEDDSLQQIIAKKILLKLGVTVDMCRNGEEALTMVSKGLSDQKSLGASHILPYEYILMDCQMPEMDGCEATRLIRLKEKDYGVRIPIIGLTAHEQGEELNKFFVAGIDTYISKPLNEHKIIEVIQGPFRIK